MPRKRNKLYGREIINIGSEIARVAQDSEGMIDDLVKRLQGGQKLSKSILKDLEAEYKKAIKMGREADKQIKQLLGSKKELNDEDRQRLKVLQQLKKEQEDKSEIMERVLGLERDNADATSSLTNSMKSLRPEVLAMGLVFGTLSLALAAVNSLYETWIGQQELLTSSMANIQMTLGTSSEQFDRMSGIVNTLSQEFDHLTDEATGIKLSSEMVLGLAGALRDTDLVTTSMVRSLGSFGRAMGTSAEETVDLFRLITTGSQTAEADFEAFSADMSNFADQIGAAPGVILQDMRAAQDGVAQFGREGVRVFQDAAMMANRFGFETRKIFDMVKGFDQFGQAAGNVNQLNAILGTSISSFELMMEQDPTQRLEMIRGAVRDMGLSWQNMSRQQIQALAQTLNITEAEVARVFGDNVSFEQLESERREAEDRQIKHQNLQMDNAELLNEALGRTTEIIDTWTQVFERIKQALARFVGPIFEVIRGTIQDISHQIEGWADGLNKNKVAQAQIRNIAEGIRGFIIDIVEWVKEIDFNQVREDAGDILDGLKSIGVAVKDFFKFLKDNKETINDILVVSFDMAKASAQVLLGTMKTVMGAFKAVSDMWNSLPEPLREALITVGTLGLGGEQGLITQAGRSVDAMNQTPEQQINRQAVEARSRVREEASTGLITDLALSTTGLGGLLTGIRNVFGGGSSSGSPSPVNEGRSTRTERTANTPNESVRADANTTVNATIPIQINGDTLVTKVAQLTVQRATANRTLG